MIGVVVGVVVLIVLWRLGARRRASRLAGLTSTAPTFSIAPPVRSLLERKDFRL